MQETLVHSLLLSVPQAAAIWLVILAVAVIAVAALVLSGRRPARDDPDPPGRRGGAAGFAAERASADRYAAEIEVAADRAAVTARRGREAWERAQEHLDVTWSAFEAADREDRRLSAAAAFGALDDDLPVPASAARGPAARGCQVTPADRERYLHRAATAACRRRELTVHELNDILAHRGDWDPNRHPVLQEVALHRAVRRRALAAYRDAVARERQAWQTAEVAAEALRSLREEACAARLRVEAPVTRGQLWWAGEALDATQPLRSVAAHDVEATVALPVLVTAHDVEATVALPVRWAADDAVTTVPISVGPLRVVPLPAAALAALRASTVQLPTMATQHVATQHVATQQPASPISRSATSASPVSRSAGHGTSPTDTAWPAMPARTVPAQTVSAQTVPGPVVPAQAGAPTAESLRQPLVAAGADAAGR